MNAITFTHEILDAMTPDDCAMMAAAFLSFGASKVVPPPRVVTVKRHKRKVARRPASAKSAVQESETPVSPASL